MPALRKIKVLVTGFGPFPGVHSNPSGKLIEWIERGQFRAPGEVDLSTAIIPASWDAVSNFAKDHLAIADPDIALHFGVSARAKGFRVEQTARNTASTSPDCNGQMFARPCLEDAAPPTLRATMAAEPLVRKLRLRGLTAAGSRDAGRYLCNMLLFLSLRQANENSKPRLCGFIHIPHLAPGRFEKSDLLSGLDIAITHCTHLHRRAISHETGVAN